MNDINRSSMTSTGHSPGPHLWEIRAVRDIFWVALVVLVIWLGYYLRSIFTPVLISFFLAYLVNPLINWLQARWRIPRPLAISLILFIFFLVVSVFFIWFGPLLSEQIATLASRIPKYLENLANNLPAIQEFLRTEFGINTEFDINTWREHLRSLAVLVQERPMAILQGFFEGTSQALGVTTQAFGFIGKVIGTTTYVLLTVMLMPIYFFFFAWYFDPMMRGLVRYLPKSHREQIVQTVSRMDIAVSSFFRGRLIIALIMGFMFAFGWLFAGVPYWFLLGMITGILNIFPYVSFIGWPVAVLLKYVDEFTSRVEMSQLGPVTHGIDWIAVFVWPSVVFMAVQFVEGWFLTPWIQSRSTDLSTVTILIVLLVGASLGGLYGLLLAIPIMACIKIVLKEVLLPQLEQWAEHN